MTIDLPINKVKGLLKVVSTDRTRKVLTSILVERVDQAKVKLTATDSYIAASVTVSSINDLSEGVQYLISAEVAQTAIATARIKKRKFTTDFELGEAPTKFPDVSSVTPTTDADSEISINLHMLARLQEVFQDYPKHSVVTMKMYQDKSLIVLEGNNTNGLAMGLRK